MAPASVTPQRLAALKELGVTRISMGVQSFQPALLEALGRRHTRQQALRAYEAVRAAGFASVNLDLIFADSGPDSGGWRADLDAAVELEPDHISTYCLTFEEDTALFVKLSQGSVRPDAEKEAAFYTEAWERLEAAGYAQYEISNFARPGHQCRHNLNTWRMEEWIGLGPSAASQYGGWRGSNVADLARWLADLDAGRRAQTDRVELTPRVLAEDSLIFGLRMNEGVDAAGAAGAVSRGARGSGSTRWPAGWRRRDWRWTEAGGLRLTLRGRLVADAVGGQIMDAFEDAEEAASRRL